MIMLSSIGIQSYIAIFIANCSASTRLTQTTGTTPNVITNPLRLITEEGWHGTNSLISQQNLQRH